jgi:hypothetical protein
MESAVTADFPFEFKLSRGGGGLPKAASTGPKVSRVHPLLWCRLAVAGDQVAALHRASIDDAGGAGNERFRIAEEIHAPRSAPTAPMRRSASQRWETPEGPPKSMGKMAHR